MKLTSLNYQFNESARLHPEDRFFCQIFPEPNNVFLSQVLGVI